VGIKRPQLQTDLYLHLLPSSRMIHKCIQLLSAVFGQAIGSTYVAKYAICHRVSAGTSGTH